MKYFKNIVQILMITVMLVFIAAGEKLEFHEADQTFNNILEVSCFKNPVDTRNLNPCNSEECNLEIEKTKNKASLLLRDKIWDSLVDNETLVLPGFCDDDDAVVLNFERESYKLQIIDSRKFCCMIYPHGGNKQNDLSEQELVVEIMTQFFKLDYSRISFNIGGRNHFKKDSHSFYGTLYTKMINNKFTNNCAFSYSQSAICFSFYYHGLDDPEDGRHLMKQKLRDPNPIIRFPELRKELGLKPRLRTEIVTNMMNHPGMPPIPGPEIRLSPDEEQHEKEKLMEYRQLEELNKNGIPTVIPSWEIVN